MAFVSSTIPCCTFASDRIAILEESLYNFVRMRAATLRALDTHAIDAAVAREDVAVIERKMQEASMKMTMLKRCMAST